ncbi:ABC transporter ATP-binding protein [Candidatus Thioglobus sp.]|uniref:ABC transporter ATP-binding protein n=1 Tax=Candidatus Thioglobus sp. TaxID=2026721 RepID=UPI003D0DBEAB
MLTVNNLSIAYQDNQVLNDFNLSLDQGDIFALLGDSGSGKSSALRFIAGLDDANAGSIQLNGVQLSSNGTHQISPESRAIGMVFQDYALFPHMTIEKNIAFGISQLAKSERKKRIKELLSLIDLAGMAHKYPHQLSGGEQQRVALARALAPNPKLLLLDEPFSSLDKKHKEQLVKQIRKILKQAKVTAILVTHNEFEANNLADKIGVIKDKQLTIKQQPLKETIKNED